MKCCAVFLDRDGVLNRARVVDGAPHPPASLTEIEILPGVEEALTLLRGAGYRLIVVTNQPDIARGRSTVEQVRQLNEALHMRLGFDDLYMCPHDERRSLRLPQAEARAVAARRAGTLHRPSK